MSEEGGTRSKLQSLHVICANACMSNEDLISFSIEGTTRSLARRLSTDSISPPASAATPTKRPRAARVSALSAIPETKSSILSINKYLL